MSRRVFDRDYKLAAVRLIVEDEMDVKEVDEMDVKEVSGLLDIHYNTLYRWVSEYEKYGQSAFPGNGVKIYDHQAEIRRLEKKNRELEEELELLKQFRAFLKRKKR